MKNVWVPIAAICMLAAIVLVIRLNFEAAFIVAALGVVAWFLNYRRQVRTRLGGFEDEDESFEERTVDEKQNAEDSLS
jgi:membrane protein implicated in regulation of membrane protease activity